MLTSSITWQEPRITQQFAGLLPGRIVQLPPSAGFSESPSFIRVTQAPIPRQMWEPHIHAGDYVRGQWIDGWVTFGWMVYNHAHPHELPNWQTSFAHPPNSEVTPAAIAYGLGKDPHPSFATIWVGEANQSPIGFRQEVLTAAPRSRTLPERLATRNGRPITVTVASDPGPARDKLIAAITAVAPSRQIAVQLSDSGVNLTLAQPDSAEVFIVADRLRWTTESREPEPVHQMIGGVIRELHCIGWVASAMSEFGGVSDTNQLEIISSVLKKAGCVSVFHNPGTQHIVHLILDAIGVSATTPEE